MILNVGRLNLYNLFLFVYLNNVLVKVIVALLVLNENEMEQRRRNHWNFFVTFCRDLLLSPKFNENYGLLLTEGVVICTDKII